MDRFTIRELRRLAGPQSGPCVSIYLATHPAGEQGQQDPVRFKNLCQQAEQQLVDTGMRPAEARQMLAEIRQLPESSWWEQRSEGIAVFLTPESQTMYRLPVPFEELAVVNQRFHIKPLLALLATERQLLVLALSQNQVQLYRATPLMIEPLEVPGVPADMATALNFVPADRGTQLHSAMRGDQGKQAAVFHGQGGQPDTHKDELRQYFRLVDQALQRYLEGETTSLVLAGVGYLLPLYREVTGYPRVVGELVGNCDYLTPYQLHQKLLPLMETEVLREREAALDRHLNGLGHGRACQDLHKLVAAASQGQVETLFVDLMAHEWGEYAAETGGCQLHAERQTGDEDLLDLAAVETLLHGGRVIPTSSAQMPGGGAIAATLRYQ